MKRKELFCMTSFTVVAATCFASVSFAVIDNVQIHNSTMNPSFRIAGASLGEVMCSTGVSKKATFTPVAKSRTKEGRLTDGKFVIDKPGMEPHQTGSLSGGKSQFLQAYVGEAAEILILDAARFADQNCGWNSSNGKAKVLVTNGPIGVLASNGQKTSWVNVYKTSTNFVHGSPGSPQE